MAMGAWITAWAITGALALVTGQFVHTWHQPLKGQIITLAAIPLSVSAFGVIIHMIRAGMALRCAGKLASGRRAPSAYDRAVAWLTTPTPWVLVPQAVLGAAFAVFVSLQFAFS